MKHEIDLKKYQIRTDLLIETINNENIDSINDIYDNIKVTTVNITEESSTILNKKIGKYITIEFEDVTDIENEKNVEFIFNKYLNILINDYLDKSCLVIGLGNEKSTPDSLGPLCAKNIVVTNHLMLYSKLDEGFSQVSSFSPGVTGETGIETSVVIENIVKSIKPDFLIVVDALASQSIERVNKTIQMTNTGIHPGSGVGNSRKEISFETLNIPVIAIGIPTVVDAVSVVSDTINYMHKHYAYNKKFIINPISKIVNSSHINYLKKDIIVKNEDKINLLGLVGSLSEQEIRQLIYEVLTPVGYNLMVTPKEIDFVIKKLSNILSNGINKSLHPKLNEI